LAARVINRSVTSITLRDRSSFDELQEMGVSKPSITLAADPTVILPSAPAAVADGLLESAGLHPSDGQRYLGITVRPWNGFEAKTDVFAAAADYAYETYGLIPVFIPIEPKLDINAARQVASRLEKAPYAILPGATSPEHIISLFSRMEIVLSMRLHALVFAAGHGVPLVGAVYDPKVSSFLDAAGQDLYTPLEQLTVPILTAHLDAAAARVKDRALREESVRKLRVLEEHNSIRAKELLDMVGLSHRRRNRLRELSGGEQQRVAIAIALANTPKLLLADEPTGAVDTKTSASILELFRKLNRTLGLTIIIVTHDRKLSAQVDRVVNIRDGRTSSEFLRRSYKTDLEALGRLEAVAGPEGDGHEEFVVLDRVGRMQVPKEYMDQHHLKHNTRLHYRYEGENLILSPMKEEQNTEA